MKRLIIGEIPLDLNIRNDEVFAPYCYLTKQKKYPNWDATKFKTNLNLSSIEKQNIDKKTSFFTLNLINDLVKKYNNLNNLNLSFKFWKKILYSWLVSLVQHSFERQLQVKSLIEKVNYPFKVELISEEVDWKINSTTDFFNVIYSVEYNHWLVSRFIEKLAPTTWDLNYIKIEYIKKTEISNDNFIKKYIRKFFNFLCKRTNKIYGVSVLNQLYLELLLRFKKPVILNKREEKLNFNKSNVVEFSYSIFNLIDLTQPLFISHISDLVNKYNRIYIPGKIILGGSQYLRGNDDFKVKIGLAIENGELFIGTQHGGDDYGLSLHCEEVSENEFNNFAFITWGWEKLSKYNYNFKKLPSPYKHKCSTTDIILVGTRATLFNRFLSARPSENQWIVYRNNKYNLLKNLSNSKLAEKLFYRPYPKTYGSLDDSEYYCKKIPNLTLANNDFHKQIMNCSILIIDHPGTTLSIAMAANIPVIMFWDKTHFPISDQANVFFIKFYKLKILFYDYENLSNYLISNSDLIVDYWYSNDVQKLRKEWCDSYAKNSTNWKSEWVNYINNI